MAAIEQLSPTLGNAFVAGQAPGGRVPATTGFPVLSFVDAGTEMLGLADSLEHAGTLIASSVLSGEERIAVAVGHADRATAASADALADALQRFPQVVAMMRYRGGPSVGAHTGPLTYGAFWWPVTR